jgi:hypothetical protein
MPAISNIYSEKIFAQHPIATWSLDDSVDYVSLITNANRSLAAATWTITGGTATSYTPTSAPLGNTTTKLISTGGTGSITSILNTGTFTTTTSSFCIGFYLYINSLNITSVDIGYKIGSSSPIVATYYPSAYQDWVFISNTFFASVTGAKVYIKINYSGTATDNEFWINGLTIGHLSEEFNKYSLGIQPASLESINGSPSHLSSQLAYPTLDYGNNQYKAYYFADNEKVFARTSSTPLAMGSDKATSFTYETSSTVLDASSYYHYPISMLFPAFGFLSDIGRNKEYTFEFWMKLNYEKWSPPDINGIIKTKILGQASDTSLSGKNGLYVSGNSLILQFGNKIDTHYVGHWNRPMLIQITYSKNFLKLFVNGEEALVLSLESSDLDSLNYTSVSGIDYIGIGSELHQIQIDSVSVYPYQFSNTQAKVNFINGLGTKIPEEINSRYNSSTVVIDYPKANYSNNYNYPEIGKWKHGIMSNFVENNNALSSPKYDLPEFVTTYTSATATEIAKTLITQNETANSYNEFSLYPIGETGETNYLKFKSLNILNEQVKGFHAILKAPSIATEKVIFKFINENNYLKITTQNDNIYYKYSNDNGVTETTITDATTTISRDANNVFFVGMDIDKFNTTYPDANLNSLLFSNPNNVQVYFNNDDKTVLSKTYYEWIVRIAFDNKRNLKNFSSQINSNGTFIPLPTVDWLYKYDNLSSYTLMFYAGIGFDISTACYWQDYVPLNLLGKKVNAASETFVYALDTIQYNIDYTKNATVQTDKFAYGSGLKTYITFQDTESSTGPNLDLSSFVTTVFLNSNNTVVPGSGTGWKTTKYEVNDRTIIYLPEEMQHLLSGATDFTKYAIVVHLDINLPTSIINPLKIKYLQFASKALNDVTSFKNSLGTKTGTKIIPYTASTYNEAGYLIDKQSSSYLNLTPQSGIKMVGDFAINRGFYVSINENAESDYTLSGMQIFLNYQFPFTKNTSTSNYLEYPTLGTIFSIETRTKTIDFIMEALDTSPTLSSSLIKSNSQRVRLYTTTNYSYTSNIIDENMYFYWNGELVKEAIITLNEWGILGINFIEPLDFNSYTGKLIVKSPISVDNISFYSSSLSKTLNYKIERPWFNLLNPIISNNTASAQYTWNSWNNALYAWQDLIKMGNKSNPTISLSKIFDIYAGVAKTNISNNESTSGLTITGKHGEILLGLTKQSTIYATT